MRHPDALPPGYDLCARHDCFMERFERLNVPKVATMVGATGDEALSDFRKALISALITFEPERDVEPPASGSIVRAELVDIAKRTGGLMTTLERMNPRTWQAMEMAYEDQIPEDFDEARWREEGLIFADVEWDRLDESLTRLREVAAAAAKAPLPSKKGRKSERELGKLIRALAAIYERHSGMEAHRKLAYAPGGASGPFLSFAVAVLQEFPPKQPKSPEALVEIIRRSLGRRRADGKSGSRYLLFCHSDLLPADGFAP